MAGRAGDRAWPGAAGEAAGWAVARRVVAGVRGGAWAGDPSLVAVVAVAGVVCGGNCSIRAATRRRHAVAMRLMVQNPPLGGGVWPGERWLSGQATGCGPADRRWWRSGSWLGWCVGNCSIRGATRRRHAVAMRLMVQNPPLGGGVWPGERWLSGQATGCGPADRRWWRSGSWLGWCVGNCSIRGATRRRHAVAMRLMVQNPPVGRRGVARRGVGR